MQHSVSVNLDTGILRLDLEPGHVPIRRLLGFAARISSKRKFLLVSKVLGKHYPVTPLMMSWSYRALARKVLAHPIGPGSIWIGMAETATGLGYGVFEAACREGVEQALFMQTTRYHLSDVERLAFEEAHSHASDFFLYYPERSEHRKQFLNAETLVLIDDEISTGKTFLRLIKAYRNINPNLKRVFIVSLVNFADPENRNTLETQSGVSVNWLCFREGLLHFEDGNNRAIDTITVDVSDNGECKKSKLAWPGRLGLAAPVELDGDTVARLSELGIAPEPQPVLVLGTGECNAPAYLLGRELEKAGFKVSVQSTTRSPIHPGNDIASVSRFTDNYGDGIPNFIYNLNPNDYRSIIVCHETPPCAELTERLHAWQALGARFELKAGSNHHAKLHFYRP